MVGETIKLAGYSSGNGWLYLGDNSVLSRVGETKKIYLMKQMELIALK